MNPNSLSNEILNVIPLSMRAIRNEMRGIAQSELTVAQFRVLTRLSLSPHTNKQLADWVGISPASMCRTIDVLVKRELVVRQHGKNSDRREVLVVLTSKGKRKYANIEQATKQMLKERLASLSEHDRKELRAGLVQLQRIFLA